MSQPRQRVNRLMKLKNTGMAAIILLLKQPGAFLDSVFPKNHPLLHHFLFTSQTPSTINNTQPANQLGHCQPLSDTFFALMGHLNWMEQLNIFLIFITLSTSDFSASSHMIQQKQMANLTSS